MSRAAERLARRKQREAEEAAAAAERNAKAEWALSSPLWQKNAPFLRGHFLNDPGFRGSPATPFEAALSILGSRAHRQDPDYLAFVARMGTTDARKLAEYLLAPYHLELRAEMRKLVEAHPRHRELCDAYANWAQHPRPAERDRWLEVSAAVIVTLPARHRSSLEDPERAIMSDRYALIVDCLTA